MSKKNPVFLVFGCASFEKDESRLKKAVKTAGYLFSDFSFGMIENIENASNEEKIVIVSTEKKGPGKIIADTWNNKAEIANCILFKKNGSLERRLPGNKEYLPLSRWTKTPTPSLEDKEGWKNFSKILDDELLRFMLRFKEDNRTAFYCAIRDKRGDTTATDEMIQKLENDFPGVTLTINY